MQRTQATGRSSIAWDETAIPRFAPPLLVNADRFGCARYLRTRYGVHSNAMARGEHVSVKSDKALADIANALKEQARNSRPSKRTARDVLRHGLLTNLPVLVTVVGGLLVFIFGLPNVSAQLNDLAARDNDFNLPLPSSQFGAATASTYRQYIRVTRTHSPGALLDDNPKTAWIECEGGEQVNSGSRRTARTGCSRGGPGIGESVSVSLLATYNLKALSIRNGVQSSEREFYRNPRIRGMRLECWQANNVGAPDFSTGIILPDERGLSDRRC